MVQFLPRGKWMLSGLPTTIGCSKTKRKEHGTMSR